MFAKRQELVFASVSAWYRIVREFNLRRLLVITERLGHSKAVLPKTPTATI
jgi:hypothetical protein